MKTLNSVKSLSVNSMVSSLKIRKVLTVMLCVLIFAPVFALAVPTTVYGQEFAKGTIYIDTVGIEAWAKGPPPKPPQLNDQQLTDLINKILSDVKRNLESAVGDGNVEVTNNATKLNDAIKQVWILNRLYPKPYWKDGYRYSAFGEALLNGDTANVYLGEFMNDSEDLNVFKPGGNWDVTRLGNAIAHTCSHEIGHLFGRGHNDNTGDRVNKMTTNEGTDTDPNTTQIPPPRYNLSDKATLGWTYGGGAKEAIRNGWPKSPGARAKSPDTREGYQGGGYVRPNYFHYWHTPPAQEVVLHEEVGGVDVLFNFSGPLASEFYFGFLGPDRDGGLEDGNPQFDFIYQSPMEGLEEDDGMLTFFGGVQDYLQFLLVGAPGSSYENQWFMLEEENLHLYDFVTQPEGDYVARLVEMKWDVDGIPGIDVQITLDANTFGEYSNPYNGFTYEYPPGGVGGVVDLPGIEEPGTVTTDSSDHNYGALAGIIVGAIVGVIMLISAVWYVRRRRTKAI